MGQALENHAALVVAAADRSGRADSALREYFADKRYLAPEMKRDVSRAVFATYRWLGWLDDRSSPQKRVGRAWELQQRFDKDPTSIKTEALAARAVPGWLASEMDLTPAYLVAIQREPALWIRTKVQTAGEVVTALGSCTPANPKGIAEGIVRATAYRYTGQRDLHKAESFQSGKFEIQDLASQIVGHACAPRPGETWWDACAGEGGKSLHLSDLMANKGIIWTTDRSERRLSVLKKRAGRAGMFNYQSALWAGVQDAPFKTKCHGVLVDAPCSGVGTWQKNPHSRWITHPKDVAELSGIQSTLLSRAAVSVKAGGRLVYAVCTLTRSETSLVADQFEATHSDFEPAGLPTSESGQPRQYVMPQDVEANGMFIACWRRKR